MFITRALEKGVDVKVVAGIVSLFGIRKHGVRPILWKAIIGIVASLAMGFAIVLLMAGSSITC